MSLFFLTLLGLGLIIASACVFNNYIDRFDDRKMQRTKNRPLATGALKGSYALIFGTLLAVLGNALLFIFSNGLTVAVANAGFIIYVCLYSFLKSKTVYSTLIGSLSGAVPPVVGYVAVSNQLDMGALILFLMMLFWQMPHFFAIALWHQKDYTKAGIPVLPIVKGVTRTKIHMTAYIMGLIPVLFLFTYFGYTGPAFALVSLGIGLGWLFYSLKGFEEKDTIHWGRQMFRFSLVLINAVSLMIVCNI